jgi:putative transposase
LAAHQKKTMELSATLVFTDESGFLLLPAVRRTLAVRGHTPVLRHRARHRDKVSVAAALTLSPARGHVGLWYRTYPNLYVNSEVYARFLRERLLRRLRNPLVVVQDQGSMHKGEPLRALGRAFDARRLHVNMMPPYAPELNPVEYLWNHLKDKELANFTPYGVKDLDATVCNCLEHVRDDQHRLRSFFKASPLPWDGLPILF